MGEMINAWKFFVGKPEGKRPVERSWRKWEGNSKTGVMKIGFGIVE
jgi:hypothetical protein